MSSTICQNDNPYGWHLVEWSKNLPSHYRDTIQALHIPGLYKALSRLVLVTFGNLFQLSTSGTNIAVLIRVVQLYSGALQITRN